LDRAVLETASDRYVIVEYLAEGGMGAIYLGKKLGVDGFEKDVVLKQLLPEYTREQKFIDLFLREARLSASLDHANVVRTVDLVNAGDDYFMVMEYVRGGDLRTLLRRARRRHRRFSPQSAVFIGHEILEALAYAHGKTGPEGKPLNLIHRDVSPSNILVSGAGEVKLTDFGIAKASTHRSVFQKVKGKVGYMSPEQARAEQVDKRADLFSLGVVLYEVLVGERLYVGDLLSSAAMVYSQKVRPPSHKREDVPPELDAVILKALSLDKAQRYQSAEEMQEAMSRAASKTRLLTNATEMAAHLKWVCGDDPSTWLKLEMLPPGADESQSVSTHGPGTAVLTGAGDDDPFGDSMPHPARPQPAAALQHKELTSVIALRGDEIELISESEALPLKPLSPKRSEPLANPPTPTPTVPFGRDKKSPPPTFENESSHAATRVRQNDNGQLLIDDNPPPQPERRRSPSGAQTLVRDHSSQNKSRTEPTAQSDPRDPYAEQDRAAERAAQRPSVPSWEEPTRASQPQQAEPAAQSPRSRRRIPTATGTLNRPAPERTDTVRKVGGRRRILPLILLLLLIGLGVAAAVAFSGPELDLPDEPGAQPANPQTQTPR
jgi:serine/threonine protein kinase